MKKYIPNAITCLNLISGCIACIMAFEGLFPYAFLWIIVAAVFDFLDGMAARLLKAYSPMGKELDSLADVVSFGVAPGMMIFFALKGLTLNIPLDTYIPYIAFLLPAFSALRLAKFNIDERQTTSFIGLPTPANAMFWASAIVGTHTYVEGNELLYVSVIIVLILIFCFLMISEIPMFSLKIKDFSWKNNYLRYILIASSMVLIILLGWSGIAVNIILYIILSIIFR